MVNKPLRYLHALVTDSDHDRVAFWRGAAFTALLFGLLAYFDDPDIATLGLVSGAIFGLIALLYWLKLEWVPEDEALGVAGDD